MTETSTIVGLDPTSGPLAREGDKQPAARPPRLDGAVVGLVANGLGEAERSLQVLFEEIASSVDLAGAVPVLKGSVSVPPDPGDWTRLTTEATVAITGFGG